MTPNKSYMLSHLNATHLLAPSKTERLLSKEREGRKESVDFEKDPLSLIILLKPQSIFLSPGVTAALIAPLFLKMKCHTLRHSAVINETEVHIHRE